jgi:hypothetical protein
VTILPDIATLKLSYYGRNNSRTARWHDAWSDAATLPRLIRIDLETVDGIKYQSIVGVVTSNNV